MGRHFAASGWARLAVYPNQVRPISSQVKLRALYLASQQDESAGFPAENKASQDPRRCERPPAPEFSGTLGSSLPAGLSPSATSPDIARRFVACSSPGANLVRHTNQ